MDVTADGADPVVYHTDLQPSPPAAFARSTALSPSGLP